MIDVVQLVREGKGYFEWAEVTSTFGDLKLKISVFRDAMKFDGQPAMTWHRDPIIGDTRIFDGVRLPASARELQQIADLLGCMLLTPKVIDLLWLQAGIKFDSIVNVHGVIVATTNITDLHEHIEAQVAKVGGDSGSKLVDSVGKYWCLINDLCTIGIVSGEDGACNYGWPAKVASGPGITPGVQVWQRPGFKHNLSHFDPSQTIRLMHPMATLVRADGAEEQVDLRVIANDPKLAPLFTHQGTLTYLRQKGVEPLAQLGTVVLPTVCV
jgi:hypothetical protein